MASSPSRCDSPSRLVGSPRFAVAQPGRPSMSSSLERKDPLSRSARRYLITSPLHLTFTHLIKFNDCFLSNNMNEYVSTLNRHRPMEGFSGEVLSKLTKHNRNKSETLETPDSPTDISPSEAVHKWFSNILKPTNHAPISSGPPSPTHDH